MPGSLYLSTSHSMGGFMVERCLTGSAELEAYDARALQIIKLATEQAEEIRALSQAQSVDVAQGAADCDSTGHIDWDIMAEERLGQRPLAVKSEPWAYYIEHPMYGVELSLDQPSERAIENGWTGTPLYAAPQPASNAQGSLPPIVDRNELIALLEDLASVNLSREAVERQARRMADDLIARGLTFAAPQPASTPANFVTIPTNLAQRLRDHLQQADSFVWLDEIQMLDAALPSTPREAPHD